VFLVVYDFWVGDLESCDLEEEELDGVREHFDDVVFLVGVLGCFSFVELDLVEAVLVLDDFVEEG